MRYARALLVLTMIGAVATPAVAQEQASLPRPALERPLFAQVGLATCYARSAVGHETANGERMSRHSLTAAHRYLAFGTIVRVTNLENGRVVKVRINDRGPNVRKRSRIIDLSIDAASALGLTPCGVSKIRIEELASDQLA